MKTLRFHSAIFSLLVVGASGCGLWRDFSSPLRPPPGISVDSPSSPTPQWHPSHDQPSVGTGAGGFLTSNPLPGGTVVATGGGIPAESATNTASQLISAQATTPPVESSSPPTMLPPPGLTPAPQSPVTQPPVAPSPTNHSHTPANSQPLPQPRPWPNRSPASPALLPPGPTPFADPHLRGVPTVTGKHWELAPWETPTDRLVELTAKLETVLAQNTALLARAKELETLGASREQALLEAMREIDSVNAAAAQEKATLLAQVTALQKRLQQREEDEIRFLEAVLEGLRKLLPPEKKP